MKDKYLFRIYLANDKGNLYSPYMPSSDYHRIGESYKAQDTDEAIMPSDTVSIFHNGKVSNGPLDSRHYGFSAIGRIKPGYSIYGNPYTRADEVLSDDELQKYRQSINKLVPEYFKNTTEFSRNYADGETNDYEYLTNPLYDTREVFDRLHRGNVITKAPTLASPGRDVVDFDSDTAWDDMIYTVRDTHNAFEDGRPLKSTAVLAATPEDKLVSVDDAINNQYDVQRDYPEELVTSEIIPVKQIDINKSSEDYANLRKKGASGKDAFFDTFRLDPTDVLSDEDKKYIYKDMSNAYNAICDRKSILDGLTQGGRRWL